MTLTSRRQPPPGHPDTIAQQDWVGARPTVARWLKWSRDFFSSIPGGFAGATPTTITPDSAGDSGLESSGWAAADHEHPIATDTAAALGSAASEGTAASFSRSDHVHKRAIETTNGGFVRRRLNFGTGFAVTDDAGNDEIDVALSPSLEDLELLAWIL